MRRLTILVVATAMAFCSPGALTAADSDMLANTRMRLVESTREYRVALDRLLVIQAEVAASARREADKRRTLLEQGIVSRREVEQSERAEAAALGHVEETQRRLEQTDSVLAETLAAIELARLSPAPSGEVVTTSLAVGGAGNTDLTVFDIDRLEQFFVRRFARPLPVSARGQTLVHERLRLDHHHALDVAVHPDSGEGRALIEYLRSHRLPFLAFRGFIPGASTGAHVHIGRASNRVMPVGAVDR